VNNWLIRNNPFSANIRDTIPLSPLTMQHTLSSRTTATRTRISLRASSGYNKLSIVDDDNVVTATGNYPSAVADRVLITRGKWYYEATLVEVDTVADRQIAIGWGDKQFFGDYVKNQGVGDDAHSWSVTFKGDIKNGLLRRSGGDSKFVAQPWKQRDVISCSADVDARQLRFGVNGKWDAPLGTLFEGIELKGGLMPAVSLTSKMKIQINFGERPFAHKLPDGYIGVHQWLTQEADRLKAGSAVASLRDLEVKSVVAAVAAIEKKEAATAAAAAQAPTTIPVAPPVASTTGAAAASSSSVTPVAATSTTVLASKAAETKKSEHSGKNALSSLFAQLAATAETLNEDDMAAFLADDADMGPLVTGLLAGTNKVCLPSLLFVR
jgi:hypothetical protein